MGVILSPEGTFGGLRCFWLSQLGRVSYQHLVVETKDSAKCAEIHRTALTVENYQAPNVDSAKIEKPCFK